MKILIIKPSSLGDVVHALPTANLLRRGFPNATIAWLINDTLVSLLKNCPLLNALIPFHRERWAQPRHLPEFLRFLRRLRAQQFDLALDLQGLFRSGVLTAASGAPRRIGLSDAREGSRLFYNEVVTPHPTARHAVDRYLETIRHLALPTDPVEFPLGESPDDKQAVDQYLSEHGASGAPLLALCPRARWENKCWPTDSYAALSRELSRRWPSHRVVLIGGRADAAHLRHIATVAGSEPLVMDGRLTLSQLTELLRRCALFVGNDSGPGHIAMALRVPAVLLFGPTDPALTGPHSTQLGRTVVLRKTLPCAPCLRAVCRHQVPIECLTSIPVSEALEACERLLMHLVGHGTPAPPGQNS